MLNSVSNQTSIRANQFSSMAGETTHLEEARQHKEAFWEHRGNGNSEMFHKILIDVKNSYDKAIQATKAELSKRPSDQEKESLLITIYSEYADFLMRNKCLSTSLSDIDFSDEFIQNLSTVKELYDAALQLAETRQKNYPNNPQEKKTLIELYGNHLDALLYLKQERREYIAEHKKQIDHSFKKANWFLTSILTDTKEGTDIRLAVVQALSKPSPLSFRTSEILVSILISGEDKAFRLAVTKALKNCPVAFRAEHKLPYDTLLSLITLLTNKEEDIEFREAAANALYRQDKILDDVVIPNEMRLGLVSILVDKEENEVLRYVVAKYLLMHPNLSQIDTPPNNLLFVLSDFINTTYTGYLITAGVNVIKNTWKR